jgi:hypothetical protein
MRKIAWLFKYGLIVLSLFFISNSFSQAGNFTVTFNSPNPAIRSVTISFTKPLFKYDNPHGYWFINPHNNHKHFNIQPDQGYSDRKEEINGGIAYITIDGGENDIDVYKSSNDSNAVSLQRGKFVVNAPTYDPKIGDANKPLHIHINNISASEIAFTLSGTAALSSTEGYDKETLGTITGSGHFYREPQYIKSDVLPACDCDPTIYGTVYDAENFIRTTSACEKALNNKLFDAVQKAMTPLFTNVANNSNGSTSGGNIIIDILPGHVDIKVPVKDRPYCSSDYYHNGLTAFDSHKKIFSNDDRFGLRFIRTVSNEAMGITTNDAASRKIEMDKMAELLKQVNAKKITMEQYNKGLQESMAKMSSNAPDIKKLEAENNLHLTIIFNASNKTETDRKLADKNNTVVTHNIKGAAFEIFSPIIKDGDGTWLNSRQGIYFGKFSPPANANNGVGFDLKTTSTTYPANANKLSIYNIIIKMDGAKDLMDKAIANIDFNALQDLIAKQ